MMLRGDPTRYSLAEIQALADSTALVTRAFVARLLRDERKGARPLGERLARRVEADEREAARRERMLELERRWWSQGVMLLAGVDEVGMGPLAGPVVAAAVILSPERPVPEADDSKVLERPLRESLASVIRDHAVAFAIGRAEVAEIAEHNIHGAGLLAMRRAVEALSPAPLRLLVDARTIPGVCMPQEAHVKGDARSCSIAAASILAKVHRDAVMRELAEAHPGYGFESHAGYSTPEHLEALRRLGPCPAHRASWSALADHAGTLSPAYYTLRDALRGVASAGDMATWQSAVADALDHLRPEEVHRLDGLARRHAAAGTRRDARPVAPHAALPLDG